MTPSRGPLIAGRRFVAGVLAGPAQAFVNTEAAGGMVLLVATLVALAWANSPWDERYFDLWHARLGVDLALFRIEGDLVHLVNDGLMSIFFLVVGLEIKRELLQGELASPRKAVLPVAAAAGGMLAPALIYAVFTVGGAGAKGWGIPMATDIAFALGALALLGRRVPFSLKVFVLGLAIVDDLGAIAIIAVFYTESIAWQPVAWAIGLFTLIFLANRAGMRAGGFFVALGIVFWVAVLKSGVHATLAGVALAALTPARAQVDGGRFAAGARRLFARARVGGSREEDMNGRWETATQRPEIMGESVAPLDRLERMLHPWVSFLIVPLFALANAGIPLSGAAIREAASNEVALGVGAGLVIGKPLGIVTMAWLACRLRWAELPENVSMAHILGAGLLCGIGFTVSLFIAGLAFESAALVANAKLGILGASMLAGAMGYVYLWIAPGEPDAEEPTEVGAAVVS
ncbi:MAG: Na+/H+ antiporter NhaA [Tepidiformaceae bacterium]